MNAKDVARILVVKLSSLGDIVHVTPSIRALRRHFPDAEIAMAVDRRFADLVRHNPHIDIVIESAAGKRYLLPLLCRTLREISPYRGRGFDLAIDFQGTVRSALWIYASRAKVKAGRGRPRPFWTHALSPDLGRHAIVVCAEVLGALGIPVGDLAPEIFLSREDEESLSVLLEKKGLPQKNFVLLNPFSRWRSKMWSFEGYASVIDRLGQDFGLPVVVTGGQGEEEMSAELLRLIRHGNVTSVVGELSLGRSLCLFRRALLMITVDSGPMHAAAALGTRVVALFGPTFPERTGPWGEGHVVVQGRRPPRHHAYRSDAKGRYMGALDPETVYEAVRRSLQSLLASQAEAGHSPRETLS